MNEAIGIYIHIPFCHSKCPYCDFHSVTESDDTIDEYIKALVAELHMQAGCGVGKKIASIFIGGGTPSLLKTAHVNRILDACRKNFTTQPNVEITMEANPESASLSKLRGYRKAGVNRVSIGVQSLSDRTLASLGRLHSADQGRGAVAKAFDAGFTNVSADFIFGAPDQSAAEWRGEIEEAAGWGLQHISCYQLTAEPGTPLGNAMDKGHTELSKDGAQMFDIAEKVLRKRGYRHYEISNYAMPGYECQHNLGYWEWRNYLGVGAAAHSFIDGARWANIKSIDSYISRMAESKSAIYRRETLTAEMIQAERLMLGLRLKKGVARDQLLITGQIKKMVSHKMLKLTKTNLRATSRGWKILDSLLTNLE